MRLGCSFILSNQGQLSQEHGWRTDIVLLAETLARAALGISGPIPASVPAAGQPEHLSVGVSPSRRPSLRRGQGRP